MLFFLTLLSIAQPTIGRAASIADLPELGKRIAHHYDCDLILVLGKTAESQEKKFQIDGTRAGQTGDDSSLALNDDTLAGSASNQMLSLKWKRKGQVIANGEMMIQISDTKAYVLLLSDPADEENQASLSCTAVSFAENAGAQP